MKNILVICLFAALLAACKKDADTSNPTIEYYFYGKLDGAPLKFEISDASAAGMATSNEGHLDPLGWCVYSYGCGIGTDLGGPKEKSVTVSFPDLFLDECDKQLSKFPLLFQTQVYPYGDTINMVRVTYFDGTDSWTSSGPLQTGASFEITKSETIKSEFGISQKVTGTLSCSLFNAAGAVKKLEGASFALSFWPEI